MILGYGYSGAGFNHSYGYGIVICNITCTCMQLSGEKLRFNRSISAIVVSVLGLALIGFILYLIGVQTTSFSEDWPAFQKQITAAFDSIRDWIAHKFGVQNISSLHISTTLRKSH